MQPSLFKKTCSTALGSSFLVFVILKLAGGGMTVGRFIYEIRRLFGLLFGGSGFLVGKLAVDI
jgi:hypothetical protein